MEKIDLNKLATVLQELEWELKKDWGLKNISGGFVDIQYNDFNKDKEIIYLTCRSGVQNDVENDVVCQEMKMDSKTFKLIN